MKFRIELVNMDGSIGVLLNTDMEFTSKMIEDMFGKIFTNLKEIRCVNNNTNEIVSSYGSFENVIDDDDDDFDEDEDDFDDEEDDI